MPAIVRANSNSALQRAVRARTEPGDTAVFDQQCRVGTQAVARVAIDAGEIDVVEQKSSHGRG